MATEKLSMARWLRYGVGQFLTLVSLALFGSLQGSVAIARSTAPEGPLVSMLARYCVANRADFSKVGLSAGSDWRTIKELPYELIGPLGGPFTSYDAWSIPQGRDQQPIILIAGVEKLSGGARHICSVRGVQDGDVIAEVRALAGGARPFLRNETMWAAFGWEDGGSIREPTDSEMVADPANTRYRVLFSVIREQDQVSITVAKMVLDALPQK